MYYFKAKKTMGLRKEKAARLKLAVLEHTLKLIGKKSFDAIYVDEICAKAKISKVTLFKYFPQKEDILLYYFRVWCLHRAVELSEKPKEGVAGITYLFDKLSEECESYPGMVLNLFGYLAGLRRPPKPFPVKVEQKKLLYPNKEDIASVEIQSVDQMFEKFTLEAIFKKEITKTTSTRDITNLLNALFYGSVITAHAQQLENLKFFFRKNLELVAKGF